MSQINNYTGAIANIYVNLAPEMMEHRREVMQIIDYLGFIAGLFDLLMWFVFFFVGSYLAFISRVKWIEDLYKVGLEKNSQE